MKKKSAVVEGTEKEFLAIFRGMCYSRSAWEVWADLICAIACSISNAVDRSEGHYGQREEEYAKCIGRIGSVEGPAKILSIIVMAL